MLTTHLQLVPRSKKRGSIHQLPHTPILTFTYWTDNTWWISIANWWDCHGLTADLRRLPTEAARVRTQFRACRIHVEQNVKRLGSLRVFRFPLHCQESKFGRLSRTLSLYRLSYTLLHSIQTGLEFHPASYPVGTATYFPGGKAAGTWIWRLISI
jgi:hypothetical protein